MTEQNPKTPADPDTHIEGRFVWHTGYLFFKPDNGSMIRMPLVVPNDSTANDIRFSSGELICLPPERKYRPGLPEELYDGYEMLISLSVDDLNVPCGTKFIEHLVRELTYPVINVLRRDYGLRRSVELQAESQAQVNEA